MSMDCDCCRGVEASTPEDVANPPGQATLRYRAGTHASFLSTMLARLASDDLPAVQRLTTREPDDFSIALLDAWATAADVLTFYGERAVTEFFLRTATERRSVLELGRLVGYVPRPGVAAGTHLAFTMEVDGDADIPAGSRVQNLPVQGQLPQSYETSAPLAGRVAFNRLGLRTSAPQRIAVPGGVGPVSVWLPGIATGLRPDDGILIDVGGEDGRTFRRARAVDPDHEHDRTRVWLGARTIPEPREPTPWTTILERLRAPRAEHGRPDPAPPDPDTVGLVRDTAVRLAALDTPAVGPLLYRALSDATATASTTARVLAARVRARIFGNNAPLKPTYPTPNSQPNDPSAWIDWDESWEFATPGELGPPVGGPGPAIGMERYEDPRLLYLDRVYPGIPDGSYVVLDHAGDDEGPRIVGGPGLTARESNRTRYGLTGACTVLDFGSEGTWWRGPVIDPTPPTMADLRGTVVHTGMELLDLADEPVDDDVCGDRLELDGVYGGLAVGRLLAVSGERAGLGIPGVRHTEIVRVADVVHLHSMSASAARPGDRNHTVVRLDRELRYCYVRGTVAIAGNVVHATHGETKSEVLGSGDATAANQRFTLRSRPLTYVSADTPTGSAGTVELRVDDVTWPERPWMLDLGPDDRGYVVRVDDDQVATIVGPDGRRGRRFPSGAENVRARYRAGIGRPGNVDAGTITLLATKPLGVRDVVNPVPATGGADPETRDEIRRNVAAPLRALDRLVSLPDYADFARTFAGVGKATADRLVVRDREVVLVTIAGAADVPLDDDSDLRRNLLRALRRFGDPVTRVGVVVRERLIVSLTATVTIDDDRDWGVVEPAVRAALLAALSFDQRDLGQDLTGSDVLAVVHRVPGVRRCVLDGLTTVPPPATPFAGVPGPRVVVRPARGGADGARPAQIAYLAAELPEFLVLTRGVA